MNILSVLRARLPGGQLLKNVGANFAGGAANGLLIVAATPWLVSLLSMEGYALVGFWLLMQMMLALFDFGLGVTLIREFAGGEREDANARRRDLLRTFEVVYWSVAAAASLAIIVCADLIATRWLRLQTSSPSEVATAIRWMGLALGLQYPVAIYTGGLGGLQRQGVMNLVQTLGALARYGLGVGVLLWKPDPRWFFFVQAFVAGAQTFATREALVRQINPGRSGASSFRVDLLRGVWRYSAGMGVSAAAAVLLANVDRLFLSKFMPTAELGKYALAFTATGMLQMGIQPLYRAYFPRFSQLFAEGSEAVLRDEYYQGCRLVAAFVIPAALVGWVFAPAVLSAWVGRPDPTAVAAMRWLLVGVSCAGLMWLPAAFQQAQGWTKLHAMMIAGAVVVGAPSLFWTTKVWGTPGAAVVWVLHGVSDLTVGLWLMHRRLLRGELLTWYRTVLAPPVLCALPIVGLSSWLMPAGLTRVSAAAWVGATGALVVVCLGLFIGLRAIRATAPQGA